MKIIIRVWENQAEGLLDLLIKKGRPSKKKVRFNGFDKNVFHMTVEDLNIQQKIVTKIRNVVTVIYEIHGEVARTKEADSSGNACDLCLGDA